MFLDRKHLKIRAERCLARTTQSSMCALKFNLWSTNTPRSLTVLEFRISWTESIYVGVVKLPIVKMIHLEYDMPICQVFAQSWTASRYFWNLVTKTYKFLLILEDFVSEIPYYVLVLSNNAFPQFNYSTYLFWIIVQPNWTFPNSIFQMA